MYYINQSLWEIIYQMFTNWLQNINIRKIIPTPPIYLHSIFAILQFELLSFSLFQTWILQAAADRKIQFKLEKNPVHQTQYFKLENCKNRVQIDR